MPRQQTVVNFDPISMSKKQGFLAKLLVTRVDYSGKPVQKTDAFGHYMFCGKQRGGKTSSVLWYTEVLGNKYSTRKVLKFFTKKGRRIKFYDKDKDTFVKFPQPPKLKLYSNFGVGTHFEKKDVFDLIDKFDPYANEVRFVLIDEFHTYFPKGSVRKEDKDTLANLTNVFSQLGKRNTYVLSTAQVYGRLEKSLREQCLYMIDNKVNHRGRIVSDFILESDILCDELGRWSGIIRRRWVHGLSKIKYDTKRLIRS